MKCHGRRLVAQSRGTYGNTNYLAVECFEGKNVPMDAWNQQWGLLQSEAPKKEFSAIECKGWSGGQATCPPLWLYLPGDSQKRTTCLKNLIEFVSLEEAVTAATQESDELGGKSLPIAIRDMLTRMSTPRRTPEGAQSIVPMTDSPPAADDNQYAPHQGRVQDIRVAFVKKVHDMATTPEDAFKHFVTQAHAPRASQKQLINISHSADQGRPRYGGVLGPGRLPRRGGRISGTSGGRRDQCGAAHRSARLAPTSCCEGTPQRGSVDASPA
jgi:hypothetical protein